MYRKIEIYEMAVSRGGGAENKHTDFSDLRYIGKYHSWVVFWDLLHNGPKKVIKMCHMKWKLLFFFMALNCFGFVDSQNVVKIICAWVFKKIISLIKNMCRQEGLHRSPIEEAPISPIEEAPRMEGPSWLVRYTYCTNTYRNVRL